MPRAKLLVFILVGSIVLIGFSVFIFGQKQNQVIKKETEINQTELKIGYITDLHCYGKLDSDTNKWEVNWRCSQPISNFTRMMNDNYKPDVIVDGGDLVDGRDKQERNLYPAVMNSLKILHAPVYHILGNHETRGFTKEEWMGFTEYEKPYQFVDVKDYRLIFLDGNNKPSIDGGSTDTSPDLRYYPGFLDSEQQKWLEETLEKSKGKKILVFVHQPPLEKTLLKDSNGLFVKGSEIRDLFAKYQVKAVFSGHIEEMCYVKDQGVDYYSLQGVHKDNRQLLEGDDYKDMGSLYQITFNEEGELEVKMFFKEKEDLEYKTLIVDRESSICNNESVKNPEIYENLVNQEMAEK